MHTHVLVRLHTILHIQQHVHTHFSMRLQTPIKSYVFQERIPMYPYNYTNKYPRTIAHKHTADRGAKLGFIYIYINPRTRIFILIQVASSQIFFKKKTPFQCTDANIYNSNACTRKKIRRIHKQLHKHLHTSLAAHQQIRVSTTILYSTPIPTFLKRFYTC